MAAKCLTVVGARPQFVKAMSVSAALTTRGVDEVVVHTGQHYDPEMSQVFFDQLGLTPPKHNLGIHGGSHGDMTGRMLMALERLLVDEAPDGVLCYGDTNSTLAAALAAAKLHIPIAHVEAGLRSFDRRMPEEVNRVMTDAVSSLLFCPTDEAVRNLEDEGVGRRPEFQQAVHRVGDVMYDTFQWMRPHITPAPLERLGLQPRGYVVATVHRPSNTDTPQAIREVLAILGAVAAEVGPVVFPAHPRTRAKMEAFGLTPPASVSVIAPLPYLDLLALLLGARMVVTDSGGLQKEALWAGAACVTLRENTEWVETVEAGFNVLVGRDMARCEEALRRLSSVELAGEAYQQVVAHYGGGEAAKTIAAHIDSDWRA